MSMVQRSVFGCGESETALSSEFTEFLARRRAKFESHLPQALALAAGCPDSLMEAMRYSLLAPGKRLRPLLVMLAAEACGGTPDDALPAASAVEMIHTYSLIHDDLPAMDDDDLRRGRPTCHKQFGEALAILAGDALLTLAFQVLADGYPPHTAAACCRTLAIGAGAGGMVGGQVEDLAAEGRAEKPGAAAGNLDDLERVHRLKTGALFRSCLMMGYHVAPVDRRDTVDRPLERLDAYGAAFGLAFQITDDLLDVEGDAGQTGKRVGKDANRGKLTYPGLLGVAESRRRAGQLVRRAVESLEPFGPAGWPLAALAEYVLARDR
jgi:geranylgeranyl diphosphate synthase, type II